MCLIISGLFGLAVCLIWLPVAEHKFCRPLASTPYNHGNWLGTDSTMSYVKYILAYLRRVADQHLEKYQQVKGSNCGRSTFCMWLTLSASALNVVISLVKRPVKLVICTA